MSSKKWVFMGGYIQHCYSKMQGKIQIRISAAIRPGLDWQSEHRVESPSQSAHFWQSCYQGNALLKPKSGCNITSPLVWAANGARWCWTGHKHPMSSCWSAGGKNILAMHLESCSGQSPWGSKDCSFIIYPIPGTALWFILLIWNSLHKCLSGLGSTG